MLSSRTQFEVVGQPVGQPVGAGAQGGAGGQHPGITVGCINVRDHSLGPRTRPKSASPELDSSWRAGRAPC
jgi:hypothetical protein